MSILMDEPQTTTETSPIDRMRTSMTAARLSFTWLGVRKSLTTEQKNQAADSFNAEGKFLSAGKKLLDTSHPAFKAVTAIRGQATSYWKGVSLPYPEPGVRLIRRDAIADFDTRIASFQEELDDAVEKLDRRYDELRSAARDRLGDLFDSRDYPSSLTGLFAIEHDYPSVDPPEYLRRLNPEVYAQECDRVRNRFDEAVQLAEGAFLEELSKLVDHVAERLSGQSDGKPKIFRDSAVTNLSEFFERFQTLNINSNEQLDELVDRAQAIVRGVEPNQLRKSGELRERVANQLTAVQSSLDDLLIDRPRRNILRRPK